MTRELRISEAAEADIVEAVDYYSSRESGVELKFIGSVEKVYRRIVTAPFSFPIIAGTYVRRALTDRFPFVIMFSVRKDHIFIYSVLHNRRNPPRWRGRIDN